jgi:hypothetical protein
MYTAASGCFVLSRALEKINVHHKDLYVKRPVAYLASLLPGQLPGLPAVDAVYFYD